MSRRTGPCCLVSRKEWRKKDVTADRSLLLGSLQKNGGSGCRAGQDLVARFPIKEWRRRMPCRAGPCWLISYRGMKDNDIMSNRTLLPRFHTKEWRIRMSCRTGPRCFISYRRMEDKDVVQDRPLSSEDVPVIQASCSNAISGNYNSVLKGSGLDNCVLFSS